MENTGDRMMATLGLEKERDELTVRGREVIVKALAFVLEENLHYCTSLKMAMNQASITHSICVTEAKIIVGSQ